MPKIPHEYTLRKDWDDGIFNKCVKYIRVHGHPDDFFMGETVGPIEFNQAYMLNKEIKALVEKANDKHNLLRETENEMKTYWSLLAKKLNVSKAEIKSVSNSL